VAAPPPAAVGTQAAGGAGKFLTIVLQDVLITSTS
jgi:hypothetical protein